MATPPALPSHFVGRNTIDVAPNGAVKDFVQHHGGHTVITSVLIANNGIAAVKEIRSVRKWAYETFGNERAISFTVMATPEDLTANADYIRMADRYVEVPGGTNNNNYANVELIVDIAERMNVDAVWAGWGHASENPTLPESLAASANKILFIGPPGSAMRSLGDKISSTIVAQHAKVPCIPWSGTGVDQVQINDSGLVTVSDDVYAQGCTKTADEALQKAILIGFPVMIKASEGGGGKGIRKVENEANFHALFHQVSSEVPGSPIFIMKLAGNARHLEVQLLADQYGNNISLFGRDCSVQRRHQKIIEEAPVTVANPATFTRMEQAAVRLGQLVGYVSAGTVEYLYSYEDDKFYFLELNPRLQVEHPTTEMVTGVNLPAAQLQIAMGLPLHRIRDIRLFYGVDPHTATEIDFNFEKEGSLQTQRRPVPKGHTTACRITSEDPGEGFKPSSGLMHELNFRSSSNVWGYFSVGNQGGIHSFSDSQFGHIFAFGENRSASRKHMVVALKELSIRGDFRTTVEYLIKLLETPDFESNKITTGWLDELISKKLTAERPDPSVAVICGAIAKAHLASEASFQEYTASLEKGQTGSKDVLKTLFPVDFIYEGFRYKFTVTRSSQDSYQIFINGSRCAVGVRALSDGGLLVLLGGKSHNVYWKDEVATTRLSVDSKTCLLEQENDPTQLRTPSPGKLVKFLVENGEHVKAGQPFAEVEVMKMYMPLVAQEDGIVQLIKQPGATLEAGDILGILALDDPSRVKHAKPFEGQLPDFGLPQIFGDKPAQKFALLLSTLKSILAGYDNQVILASTLNQLFEVLKNPELPYSEWNAQFSALHSRIPQKLDASLTSLVERAKAKKSEFPAKSLVRAIARFQEEFIPVFDALVFQQQVEPLVLIAKRYEGGLKAHEYGILRDLLNEYINVEKLFSGSNVRDEDVVLRLRDENKEDIKKVVNIVFSHGRVGAKNNLVLAILAEFQSDRSEISDVAKYLRPVLTSLTELDSRVTSPVTLKARELLILCSLPSLEERTAQLEHILRSSVVESRYGEAGLKHGRPRLDVLKEVIDSQFIVFDVLPKFFAHPDTNLALAALELYVRRAYRAYNILGLDYHTESDSNPVITFKFLLSAVGNPAYSFAGQSNAGGRTGSGENFQRAASVSDLTFIVGKSDTEPVRQGVIVPVQDLDEIDDVLPRALEYLPRSYTGSGGLSFDVKSGLDSKRRPAQPKTEQLSNVFNILIKNTSRDNDSALTAQIKELLDDYKEELVARSIRRITFVCGREDGSYPAYFTFRGPNYEEDESIRHIEPALAYQLELGRLSNFNIKPIFTDNRNIHVYQAVGKDVPTDKRFFTRGIVRPGRLRDEIPTSDYLISETDRLMSDILDGLEVIGPGNSDMNHIFINFSPIFHLVPEEVEAAFGRFLERFGRRLWRLRVTGAEIRIMCTDPETNVPYPLRAIITNVSGYVVQSELYTEIKNDKGEWVFKSLGKPGNMHLRSINTPYPTKEWLQPKRYKAHLMGTTYVYDFPELFNQAIRSSWLTAGGKAPEKVLTYKELILDDSGELSEVSREPGANNTGMVAWIFTALTPESPKGRQFIVVANDITFKIGSFGPLEDRYFHAVTEFARKLGIPRVYLSANSGARIGVADEFISLFSVAWNDPARQDKGFKYLYLTPATHGGLTEDAKKAIVTERVVEDDEERFKIVGIIGTEDGLGVECLRGSGLIAGATSKAYKDIFTITLVTCRSVGIGAYLVRLGQRAIQIEGQPIILTGAPAINKLLGREVYTSNLQLGGTQIMYRNGVSHLTANDDLAGVIKIVEWISYVPEKRNSPLPIFPSTDTWDREVTYQPPKQEPYDVRWLIAGKEEDEGNFEHGLFDKGSFQETLSGWARTVVVGRARLGGIPVGVIGVEVRSVENLIPADPANPDSTEQLIQEAGQVWYPNSAFKTAQAINDFNHGEELPLIILANWRGFSGGQRDMYNEVLKYGAFIVDALVDYKQPIFVYIPPHAELRGGSWVVIDPTINAEQMEMYADEDARGGVLEPEGMVGIKYRREKLLETIARTDATYADLKRQLEKKDLSQQESSELKIKLSEREQYLLPIYKQISIQFADLHDRASRMKAKGAIRQVVAWKESRRYFYWRLRRRLTESYVLKDLAIASPSSSRLEKFARLKSWYAEAGLNEESDADVAEWIDQNGSVIKSKVADIKQNAKIVELLSLVRSDKATAISGIVESLKALSVEDREKVFQLSGSK
ncbi:acetyl-CoA carboxylase [Lipomyces japonicus]|uniref:acetyl-CoA carboxylase n=1 Tax=Lipomyces japonicus TaxID=56871 RepID=UPI0034CDE0AF